MFNKVIIIGAGLIGSSIARGLQSKHLSKDIVFLDKNDSQDSMIKNSGFLVGKYSDISHADLVILAIPALSIPEVLREVLCHSRESCHSRAGGNPVIMDTASTKALVLDQAESILQGLFANFVGAHPIAGKETSGFAAGDANLFNQHSVVLTPTAKTNKAAFFKVKQLWQALGSDVVEMSAAEHDLFFASYSHLSNILAFVLMAQAKTLQSNQALLPPSFIDMTRLAASNPAMWRDICLSNKASILKALGSFEQDLANFKALLNAEKSEDLFKFFLEQNQLKKELNLK